MKKVFLFVNLFFCISLSLSRADEKEIVESFVYHAHADQNKGNFKESSEDFARALLLNPNNREAQDQLAQQAFLPELPSKDRILLLTIKDLLKFNNDLNDRKKYLNDKIQILKSFVLKNGFSQTQLQQQLRDFKSSNIVSKPTADEASINPLVELQKMLLSKREELFQELNGLEKQIVYLRDIMKSYETTILAQDLQKKNSLTSVVIDDKNPSREFKAELESLKTHVKDLEKVIEEKDKKLDQLSQQIVNLSMEVTEDRISKEGKNVDAEHINLQISELRSRLELGQKILQDKDGDIHELQRAMEGIKKQMDQQKKEFEQVLAKKESLYKEQSEILALYKAKLYDTHVLAKEKSAQASSLKSQLDLIESKLFHKELALNQTKHSLEDLEFDLENLEKTMGASASWTENVVQRSGFYSQILDLRDQLKKIQTSL
jgi:hypothetical protein